MCEIYSVYEAWGHALTENFFLPEIDLVTILIMVLKCSRIDECVLLEYFDPEK